MTLITQKRVMPWFLLCSCFFLPSIDELDFGPVRKVNSCQASSKLDDISNKSAAIVVLTFLRSCSMWHVTCDSCEASSSFSQEINYQILFIIIIIIIISITCKDSNSSYKSRLHWNKKSHERWWGWLLES